MYDVVLHQSLGQGCQKSIRCARHLFSKVDTTLTSDLKTLHHFLLSGVVKELKVGVQSSEPGLLRMWCSRESSRALNTTPYTLHPTPCIHRPPPSALHPTPYTLHLIPTPHTLAPTPYTLQLTPLSIIDNGVSGGGTSDSESGKGGIFV